MEDAVVGWKAAALVACRHESWIRRHVHELGGVKGEDGNWRFGREALEGVRPADTVDTVVETVEPDADTSTAAAADDDIERVSIRSGTPEPDNVEVVRIATEARKAAAAAPPDTVQMVPVGSIADEHGITGATYSVVFVDFDDNKRIADIVERYNLLPETVEIIAAAYRRVCAADVTGPTMPAALARLEAKDEAREARIARLERRVEKVIAAHNTLVEDLNAQAQGAAEQPDAEANADVERSALAEQVAELTSRLDEIADFLHEFVPAAVMRRDIEGIVRGKLLFLLPRALQRMFPPPVPPGACNYES